MYFKTSKSSNTGKKFLDLNNKIKEAIKARKPILEKYGATLLVQPWHSVGGGIAALVIEKEPDLQVWKLIKDYLPHKVYSPRLNTKIGKQIEKEFEALPVVTRYDLNMCIGYDNNLHRIGFSSKNVEFFGFEVADNFESNIPDDCTEITHSEYKKLFNN